MAQLAILGGAPAIVAPLGKPWPIFGDLERRLLNDVLESGLWNRGRRENPADSMTGRFEDAFARFQDAKHALAVTNGTAAIECALKAVDVEPGDEAI
ncbi:MAG: DegT/DnrJ/EryC1/StrS family aminotransferase, partial [Candidatus Sumerlaeota bacterium]|nr:DegT/DnrJ/EryC1/StrS family aminotransferase [Candidatus Sumerlaeota bacterium]